MIPSRALGMPLKAVICSILSLHYLLAQILYVGKHVHFVSQRDFFHGSSEVICASLAHQVTLWISISVERVHLKALLGPSIESLKSKLVAVPAYMHVDLMIEFPFEQIRLQVLLLFLVDHSLHDLQ